MAISTLLIGVHHLQQQGQMVVPKAKPAYTLHGIITDWTNGSRSSSTLLLVMKQQKSRIGWWLLLWWEHNATAATTARVESLLPLEGF